MFARSWTQRVDRGQPTAACDCAISTFVHHRCAYSYLPAAISVPERIAFAGLIFVALASSSRKAADVGETCLEEVQHVRL